MRWLGLGLFLLIPFPIQAAVYISEIAWMGDTGSANHEWIELHNDSGETDVTGWTLTDGMNLSITLAGVIPANAYVVLERTSDESSTATTFLIYTGALVNTGATLRLLRADNSLEDQVAGGDDWKNLGGDNVTKETAQYTPTGWVTAAATPGSKPPALPIKETENTTTTTTKESTSNSNNETKANKSSSETVVLELPDVTLALRIKAQKIGYVHQPITFKVEPTGIGDTLIDSLQYQWNFGDGSTALAQEAKHIFAYPGTYLVTIYAGFKRQEQVARQEITILPVNTSLTLNEAGDVQINNDSLYEIDISGYRLLVDKEFIFPKYSILLPKQTVTIPKEKLGSTKQKLIALYDTESALVSSIIPFNLGVNYNTKPNLELAHKPQPRISAVAMTKPAVIDQSALTFTTEAKSNSVVEVESISPVVASSQLASVVTQSSFDTDRLAYLGLVLVISLGIFAVFGTGRSS